MRNALSTASLGVLAPGILAIILTSTLANAQTEPPFFQGKTVDLIISTEAGIAFDVTARLVGRHIGRHIPGTPSIVARNMPGAGHIRAANYIYNQAPKDGTTIGTLLPVFVTSQVIDRSDAIQFDAAKFNWIGSSAWATSTTYVMASTGVASIEDAKKRQVLMGGTGAGAYSTLFPVIMNNLLGTKFKVIAGYKGTAEMNIAMERGEVEGRAGVPLPSIKLERPEWLAQKKINIIVQVGLERDPELQNVPLLIDFARDDEQRAIIKLFSSDAALGRPFIAPPGLPPDRVATLRNALAATMKDPAYLKEAKDIGAEVVPVTGEKLQAIVDEIVATPAAIVAKAKAATERGDSVTSGAGGTKK